MMEIQKMVSEKSNFGFRISPACTKRSGEGRDFGFLIPHSAFRIPQSKGFTLIEVILVMVIIGILAATVVPRIDFTISTRASVDGAAYMVASDIRYVQECAMANRVSKSVTFTLTQNFYTFPATVPSTSSLDPSGRLPEGVTISSATYTLIFNSLGEPTSIPTGSPYYVDLITVSAGGLSRTIRIWAFTGKVVIL
jgi:prepilin-type N-terminal cleavage/methylation domain-containing protein